MLSTLELWNHGESIHFHKLFRVFFQQPKLKKSHTRPETQTYRSNNPWEKLPGRSSKRSHASTSSHSSVQFWAFLERETFLEVADGWAVKSFPSRRSSWKFKFPASQRISVAQKFINSPTEDLLALGSSSSVGFQEFHCCSFLLKGSQEGNREQRRLFSALDALWRYQCLPCHARSLV